MFKFLCDRQGMKTRFFSTLFMLSFILLTGSGEAFVPQAPHLIYLVVDKIKQPVGIEIVQTKKILNFKDTPNGYLELEERLIYAYPNQLRSEIISEPLTSFSVESDFRFIKVKNRVIVSHEKPLVDLYTDILFYRDHESLLKQISLAGIDTEKVSFQRYEDTICYVIGSLEKAIPHSSLWIEKESFLPVKYVVEKNGLKVEFLYLNWQRYSKTWYPMQVSIFLDHQLFATVDVQRFDLKSGLSPSLFAIDHIEQSYPKNNPDPADSLDENSKQVDELGKRLEDFKKLYE